MLPLRPTLLAAALVAANLAHAEVPASAPFTPEQQYLIRQLSASEVKAATPEIASEAASSVAKTIAGEKQAIEVAKDTLEVGRKSVDWWLNYLGVWLGGLGLLITLAGIGIPFLMGRQQKAEWKERMDEISSKSAEANAAKEKTEAARQQAEQHASEIEALLHSARSTTNLIPKSSEIEKLLQRARDKTSLIPNAEQIAGKLSDEVLAKLRNEKPPQVMTLVQQAWKAHENEDWAAARPMWELLSLIESQDSNVWFNLGVVHSEGSRNWAAAAECFERSNLLGPHPSTLFNWANCIYQQGLLLKQGDKLREAIAKYREAYTLDENFSFSYFQRAVTLVELATWVSDSQKHVYFAEAQADYENAIKHGFQVKREVYESLAQLMELWANSLTGSERQEKLDSAANYQKQAEQAL